MSHNNNSVFAGPIEEDPNYKLVVESNAVTAEIGMYAHSSL